MKIIPITLKIGGIGKEERQGFKDIGRKRKAHEVFSGLTTGKLWRGGKNDGKKEFVVWINSRNSEREFIDTFYHEITHMVCKILGVKSVNEEALCCWIGYLAKGQFADLKPERFGRKK